MNYLHWLIKINGDSTVLVTAYSNKYILTSFDSMSLTYRMSVSSRSECIGRANANVLPNTPVHHTLTSCMLITVTEFRLGSITSVPLLEHKSK